MVVQSLKKLFRYNEEISNYAYIGFVFIMSAAKALGLDKTNGVYHILGIIALVLGSIAVFFAGYEKNELLILFILGVYMGITFYLSHQPTPVIMWFAFAGAKRADGNQIKKALFYIWFSGFLITIILASVGAIPVNSYYHAAHGRYRYGLGYHNGNMVQIVVFLVITIWGYYYENKKIWMYLILSLINIVVYLFSDSRTGFYAAWLSLASWIVLAVAETKKWTKIWNRVMKFAGLLPCAISIWSFYYADRSKQVWAKLDKLFTTRIFLIEDVRSRYTPSLLAQDMTEYWWLMDNVYIHMFLQYGMIYLMLFMALYVWLFWKTSELFLREKTVAVLILICGVVEQFVQNCFMNYSLLFIFFMIWNRWKDKEKDNIGFECLKNRKK